MQWPLFRPERCCQHNVYLAIHAQMEWRWGPLFLKMVTWASQWQLVFLFLCPCDSTAHTQEICTNMSQNGTRTQSLMAWKGLASKAKQFWANIAGCIHNIEWITHWKQVEQMVALKPKHLGLQVYRVGFCSKRPPPNAWTWISKLEPPTRDSQKSNSHPQIQLNHFQHYGHHERPF